MPRPCRPSIPNIRAPRSAGPRGFAFAPIHPSNVDRAFPLDEPHHAGYRLLRRHAQQHVHMVEHHMPLFHLALLLLRQRAKHRPQVPPQLPIQRLAPAFRDEHHVIASTANHASRRSHSYSPVANHRERSLGFWGACFRSSIITVKARRIRGTEPHPVRLARMMPRDRRGSILRFASAPWPPSR
jgi:hypothetical protein